MPEKSGTSANDLLDLKRGSEGPARACFLNWPVVRGCRGDRPGVPPARQPPGGPHDVGPHGVDHPRGAPRGVDPHGVVHPYGVAVHPRGVELRGVVRVVHPRGVGPHGFGRPRGVYDLRGVVHPRDGRPWPAAAVCWTVAEVLRSR